MTSSHYSFILWKVEIVYWCDGNSELRKFGDCTVHHDLGGGTGNKGFIGTVLSERERGCTPCPKYRKGGIFHREETISRLVYNSSNKGFAPTNDFLIFIFIVCDYTFQYVEI